METQPTRHTPGPWSEFCENGDWWIAHIDSDGEPMELICNSNGIEEADVDLICAAPELLEACEEAQAIHSWLHSFFNDVMNTAPEYIELCGDWNATQYMMQDCDDIANRIRAAIAKARGEGA